MHIYCDSERILQVKTLEFVAGQKKKMHFTYIYEMCNLIWLHLKIELVVATYSGTIGDIIVVVRVFVSIM